MKIISIKGTNITLTDSIVDTIEKKLVGLSKLTERLEPMAELAVEVGKSTKHHRKGPFWRAEATMQVAHKVLRAECTDIGLYGAIDLLKDELSRQIIQHKEKGKSKAMRGARVVKKMKSVDTDAISDNDFDLSKRHEEEGI